MKNALVIFSVLFALLLAGCQQQKPIEKEPKPTEVITETKKEETKTEPKLVSDVVFDNAMDYITYISENNPENFKADKPEGYDFILFGEDAVTFTPDGVNAEYTILVKTNVDRSNGLREHQIFYFEAKTLDSDCFESALELEGETECPTVTQWYGPFKGPAFAMVQ